MGAMSAGELTPEQKEEIPAKSKTKREQQIPTEASRKRSENLIRKLDELTSNQMAAIQKQEDTRREAAVRLAYLAGDDAVRAKVHFIGDEREVGEGNPIGPIMRDGLPSSRNKQLQLTLLEAAWRDPRRVPNSELHNALRQAKELTHKGMGHRRRPCSGQEQPRNDKWRLTEYQAEINEIIATLPLRTESNRAETIDFLKKLAVPNKQQSTNTTPD